MIQKAWYKSPVPNVDVATQVAASRRAGPGPRRRSARPRWRAARRRRSSQQAARGRQPSTHISLTSRHYPAFCGCSCNLHIILDIIYETNSFHSSKQEIFSMVWLVPGRGVTDGRVGTEPRLWWPVPDIDCGHWAEDTEQRSSGPGAATSYNNTLLRWCNIDQNFNILISVLRRLWPSICITYVTLTMYCNDYQLWIQHSSSAPGCSLVQDSGRRGSRGEGAADTEARPATQHRGKRRLRSRLLICNSNLSTDAVKIILAF